MPAPGHQDESIVVYDPRTQWYGRHCAVYPRGSTYQPEEIGLPLTVQDLIQLDESLRKAGPEPTEISMSKFAIVPISAFQRAIGDFLKWITRG